MSQARKVSNKADVQLTTYKPREIEGLLNFPAITFGEEEMIQEKFPEKWRIVVHCPSEKSATKLADFLRSLGY